MDIGIINESEIDTYIWKDQVPLLRDWSRVRPLHLWPFEEKVNYDFLKNIEEEERNVKLLIDNALSELQSTQ